MEDQIVVKSRFLSLIVEGIVERYIRKTLGVDALISFNTISAFTEDNSATVHIDMHVTARQDDVTKLIDQFVAKNSDHSVERR